VPKLQRHVRGLRATSVLFLELAEAVCTGVNVAMGAEDGRMNDSQNAIEV